MNSTLEDRLTSHFRDEKAAGPLAPTDVAPIRRLARRRSMRNRAVAGVCGAIALAGIGSLVSTGGEPNALITATDPAPEPTTQPTEVPVEEPTPEPDPPPTNQDQLTPESEDEPEGRSVLAPQGFTVISDGQGGFVALLRRTDGELQFARSTNGQDWFAAESAQLPGPYRVDRLRFVDGMFVLELDVTATYEPDAKPKLAVSTDLETWDIIDLVLDDDARRDGDLVSHLIGDIAINDDAIGVVVLSILDIDTNALGLSPNKVCGYLERDGVGSLLLCDGTVQQVDPTYFSGGDPGIARVLVSRNNGAAREIGFSPSAPAWGWWQGPSLVPSGDSFAALNPGQLPVDLVDSSILDRLDADGPVELVATDQSYDTRVVVLDTGERLVLHVADPEGETLAELPPEADRWTQGGGPVVVRAGNDGWTVALLEPLPNLVQVAQGDWEFTGIAGSLSGLIRSPETGEFIRFDVPSVQTPPWIQVSLFGGVRYFHPVTGELLIELSAEEFSLAAPVTASVDPAAFDRSMEVDGWTLTGNPLAGPLLLTAPSGETAEFADGFAFDNGDISDGVETDIAGTAVGDFILKRTDPIVFYDALGNELVTFPGRTMHAELTVPIVGSPDITGRLFGTSEFASSPDEVVLFSRDAITWDVIWTSADADSSQTVANVVVGDDEVILGTPFEIARVPLDD